MGMSKGMYAAGLAELIAGALIVFTTESQTWQTVGLVIAGLGGLAIGVGFSLGLGGDPVEDEVDRWETAWNSEWSPVCPVHGSALCPVRTRQCPGYRERETP